LYERNTPPVIASAYFGDQEFLSWDPPEAAPDGMIDIFYRDIDDFDEQELRRFADDVVEPGEIYFRQWLKPESRKGAVALYPTDNWRGHAHQAVSLAVDCVRRLTGKAT
jgi:hypothetical protein